MTNLSTLQQKRELYWQQVEEALKAAGMTVGTDERGMHVVHAGDASDSCELWMTNQQTNFCQYTGAVELNASRGPYGHKHFPELKKGGFNLKLLCSHVAEELAARKSRREKLEADGENFSSAQSGLERIARDHGLTVAYNKWPDGKMDDVAGVAAPITTGAVEFEFTATIEQAERVLVLLLELGIIEREDSDA